MSKRVGGYQDKKALSVSEVLDVVPFGRTVLYEVLKSKKLVARKLGRRTIILSADLDDFLRALPVADEKH